MGTFAGYYGSWQIPEDQKRELAKRMRTLFVQGGMMQCHMVRLFETEIFLLQPAEYDKDNRMWFSFNYFEDDFWEDAGFDAEKAVLFSNKIGGKQFHRVICTAYVLMEFYSEEFGMATIDGRAFNACEPIGWLNYLFEENHTNARAWDLWRVYQLLPEDSRGEADLLQLLGPGEIQAMSSIGFLKYMYVAHRDELEKELAATDEEPSDQQDNFYSIFHFCKLLSRSLDVLRNAENSTQEKALERCKTLLLTQAPRVWEITQGSAEELFTMASMLLPWEITVKFLADAFALNFQTLYNEMEPLLANQKAIFNDDFFEESIQNFSPIAPVHTSDFLRCTDDDRVLFWRENGDVIFSPEMEAWLAELTIEFNAILAIPETLIEPTDLLRQFLELLRQIDDHYHRLYCFSSTFCEFMRSPERREVQAAVLLLKRLAERYKDETDQFKDNHSYDWDLKTPGRLNIKRYLALLANFELRQRILGF